MANQRPNLMNLIPNYPLDTFSVHKRELHSLWKNNNNIIPTQDVLEETFRDAQVPLVVKEYEKKYLPEYPNLTTLNPNNDFAKDPVNIRKSFSRTSWSKYRKSLRVYFSEKKSIPIITVCDLSFNLGRLRVEYDRCEIQGSIKIQDNNDLHISYLEINNMTRISRYKLNSYEENDFQNRVSELGELFIDTCSLSEFSPSLWGRNFILDYMGKFESFSGKVTYILDYNLYIDLNVVWDKKEKFLTLYFNPQHINNDEIDSIIKNNTKHSRYNYDIGLVRYKYNKICFQDNPNGTYEFRYEDNFQQFLDTINDEFQLNIDEFTTMKLFMMKLELYSGSDKLFKKILENLKFIKDMNTGYVSLNEQIIIKPLRKIDVKYDEKMIKLFEEIESKSNNPEKTTQDENVSPYHSLDNSNRKRIFITDSDFDDSWDEILNNK